VVFLRADVFLRVVVFLRADVFLRVVVLFVRVAIGNPPWRTAYPCSARI